MAKRKSPRKQSYQRSTRGGGDYWIYGHHAVEAALANPARTALKLLVASGQPFPDAIPDGLDVQTTDRRDIDQRVGPGAVHQGLALLVRPLENADLSDLARMAEGRDRSVVVVLDQVTDPHNVGAVLRSAAAFGALGVVVQDRHAPDESGTLAKSASGGLETVPIVRATNLARALDDLKSDGFWCLGLDGEADVCLPDHTFAERTALVIGAEGTGLRHLVAEHCDMLIKIPMPGPMRGDMESLNLSNAAAVALYDWAVKSG